MPSILLLVLGLALLVKGADLLVSGAASIAARLGISPLVIGLTVVSFGTSLPEMLVTLVAGLRNNADFAIANIVGSNIANVLLVLGIAAMIRPLPVRNSTVVSEIPFSLAAALLVGFLANAALFSNSTELSISRLDGLILLGFMILFMFYIYSLSRDTPAQDNTPIDTMTSRRAVISISVGLVCLYMGGQWVVDGAVGLARLLDIDDAIIGLTIVAIGTSTPEIVASAVAAYKGQTDIAVGNVIGSNIFNLLWVLGFTAAIVELPFEVITNMDIAMVICSSTLIFLALAISRKNTVMRSHGVFFVALYIAYLFYVITR